MYDSYQFNIPFVEASQAQKHVTVNEALAILDAVAQLRFVSMTQSSPPGSAVDGQAFWIPSSASGSWNGHDETIAIFANGGWIYLAPKEGWRAWDEDTREEKAYINSAWVATGLSA